MTSAAIRWARECAILAQQRTVSDARDRTATCSRPRSTYPSRRRDASSPLTHHVQEVGGEAQVVAHGILAQFSAASSKVNRSDIKPVWGRGAPSLRQ